MSPQDFLQKIQLFIALWRTRHYDQLAAAGAIAGAGAFIWALNGKTPIPLPDSYRTAALILLAAFTVACTVFLVVRVSRIQDPNTGAAAQALPSSVRGPLPFTEADGDLFRKLGRDYLIGQALAFVTNDQIPVILVSGESGVGKTSLLRAGLTSPLKDGFGRNVIYWEAKPTNPLASLTATVVDALGNSAGLVTCDELFEKKPLPARPVIIIDQLEQLSPANETHLPVYDLIVKAAHAPAPHPATWIISFRRDFVGIYEFLAERGLALPFVLVTAFTREEAEQVMATLADKAGVSFERQLLKDFTASAAVNGAVSSVDIGIGTLVLVNLAKHAKKDTITLDDYKFAGGSSGVLTAYVSDQLAVYPEAWQDAVLKALLSLIDLAKNQRIAEGRTASALSEGSTLPPGRLGVILDSLAAPHIRILEKLEASAGADPVFRLPHERFIQPIRTLAGSLLAKENLAQFVLDSGFSSWMRSRDPRLLLSGKDLKQVQSLVAQRASAFSGDILDYVRRSLRHEHLKLVKRTAACVLAVLLFAFVSIRRQWIPQTTADLRPAPGVYVVISSFPDAGVVMTGPSGEDSAHILLQHNVSLWRARDGKLLTKVPGALRATCPAPEKILLSGPGGKGLSIFDIRRLSAAHFDGFIPEDEYPLFVGLCEYFGFIHNPGGSLSEKPDNETLHFWETGTGQPVSIPGTYPEVNVGGLYPNRDPAKSILIRALHYEPELWNLASGKIVAALTRHGGNWFYMVDYARGLVAVRESLGNARSAVELWDLHTGALLRQTTVDGFVGSLHFISNGTLLFMKANDNTGTLLRVSDFTPSPLLGRKDPTTEGGTVIWFQSGKDTVVLDQNSTGVLHLQSFDMTEVSSLATNNAMSAALVLEKDGTLVYCADSRPCKIMATGVASIGQVNGTEAVFTRAKQDNSLSLFDFAGKALGRGLGGDWGSVYAISYNSRCGDIFAWASTAELLRYRPRWTFFGRPFADVHVNCQDE